jgi:hypothetical protein
MKLRERFKQNISKALAKINVKFSDDSIGRIAEAAFGNATDTVVRYGRLESKPNNHESRATARFISDNCPDVVKDCHDFVKKCITDAEIEKAREAIETENKERRNYNRVRDLAERMYEDVANRETALYTKYVERIAEEYAKRDAKKIYEAAREHFIKQR